jgi:DnaK suppressor protein
MGEILYFTGSLCYDKNAIFVKPFRRFKGKAMKKKDIKYFEDLLNKRLEELLSQAGNTVSGMTTPRENFPDPTDRAALEADRNFMLRIRDREHKLIKKIKKALERIEKGTFGICESCGEDISLKRMKARPVTSQCIECKSKEEALEKALGL